VRSRSSASSIAPNTAGALAEPPFPDDNELRGVVIIRGPALPEECTSCNASLFDSLIPSCCAHFRAVSSALRV
jgi:hypothetical protein